jgi:hypothetical protein
MKRKQHITHTMVIASFLLGSCTPQGDKTMNDGPAEFATAEEAAMKGKSDLVSILASQKELDLAVDRGQLEGAQQAPMIRYAEVDLQRLLSSDSVMSLGDIAAEKSLIAPFAQSGRVITVIEVAQAGGKWKAAALGNKTLTDALNATGLAGQEGVTIYEVPNLQVTVYGVRTGGGEVYHLNYDRFTAKDSTSIKDLFPVLRDQARQFQQQFGDQMSKDQLVN